MKISKKIISFLQNDIYYYLCLGVIVLAYDLNLTLNIVLYALFIINLGLNLRSDKFLYTFFALVFFEVQVHSGLILSGWMFSSLMQVYYIAFAVRVVLDVLKKTKYKSDIPSLLLAVWFAATAVLYQTSFSSGVLFMIKNGAVVLYILFYIKANRQRNQALADMLGVIALFAVLAGVYGLSRSLYWDNRLGSTNPDPNYSAMFFGLGLFASFGASRFKKWFRLLLSASLGVLLLLTMSITGIFLIGLNLIIYFLLTAGLKRVLVVAGVLVALLAGILLLPTKEGTTFYNLQNRVSKIYIIDETDYTLEGHDDYTDTQRYINYITNNRYYLVQSYGGTLLSLPAKDKFLGGHNVMTGPYRAELEEKYLTVSHNSYIDMAFMTGIIFTLIFLVLIGMKMAALIKEYHRTKSREVLSLILLKSVVLVFGLTISYFPYRYFLVFMML